ncbi:hypothetical protein Hanom_Chr01g00023671 [Helianthus anomalus]
MVCLKFLWTVRVWILSEIVVFYDFVHFVGKMDFVAEHHPILVYKLNIFITFFFFVTFRL